MMRGRVEKMMRERKSREEEERERKSREEEEREEEREDPPQTWDLYKGPYSEAGSVHTPVGHRHGHRHRHGHGLRHPPVGE